MSADFWKLQPSTLQSMFLNQDAPFLDAIERPETLALLPPFEHKRVLDLAAGIGRFTGEFAKTATHVTSVDLAPQFILQNKRNNERFSNIDYLCKDARELHFARESFDLIFSHSLMMYLEDQEATCLAAKMIQWLAPSGHLFIRESCSPVAKKIEAVGAEGTYIAYHRSERFYHQLFDPRLTLVKSGQMQVFIDYLANPFKCYWHYAVP